MKILSQSFLVLALTLLAGNARADEAKAIFQYNNANMLSSEFLQVSILDNGDVHALRAQRFQGTKPAFNEVISRLDRDQLAYAKAGIALLLPSMKLRELTKAEKERQRMCAMDSAVNYSVPSSKFEQGRLIVRQAQGCGLTIGLATRSLLERRAEVVMKALVKIVDKAVTDNYDRIYR